MPAIVAWRRGLRQGATVVRSFPRLFAEQLPQHDIAPCQKRPRDLKVFGVLILDPANAGGVEFVNPGVGISHDDRRMRCDDELALVLDPAVERRKKRQLPLWTKGRFGLVEEVESAAGQTFGEKGKKR